MNRRIPVRDRKESLGDRNHRYLDLHVVNANIDRLGRNLSLNGKTLAGNALFTGDIVYNGEITFNDAVAINSDLSVVGDLTLRKTAAEDCVLTIIGGEGEDAVLLLHADKGDDDNDKWKIFASASNHYLLFGSYVTDNYKSRMWLTPEGNLKLYRGGYDVVASGSIFEIQHMSITAGGNFSIRGINVVLTLNAKSLRTVSYIAVSGNTDTTVSTIGLSIGFSNKGDGYSSGIMIGTIAASGDGDVQGLYITNNLSTTGAGTVYAIKSIATEDSYFAGDICFTAGKGISLNALTKTQTIIGDAGGITFKVPAGDNFDFKVNNVSVLQIAAGEVYSAQDIALASGKELILDGSGGGCKFKYAELAGPLDSIWVIINNGIEGIFSEASFSYAGYLIGLGLRATSASVGGVANSNTITGTTDTPTAYDEANPDGFIKAYVGTQAVTIPYWNT